MSVRFVQRIGILALLAMLAGWATPLQSQQEPQDLQDPALSQASQAFEFDAISSQDGKKKKKEEVQKQKKEDYKDLIRETVQALVKGQAADGQWSYEGVVGRPIGMKVGGTSITASALLHAGREDKEVMEAVNKALTFVLTSLQLKTMMASTKNDYDVRIWGQMAALEFLCHLRMYKAAGERDKEVDEAISKLIEIIAIEQLKDGGWNYARMQGSQAPFCTIYVVQGLLYAQGLGYKVSTEVLDKARAAIESSRYETFGYAYGGKASKGGKDPKGTVLPGSISRTISGETTLVLMGTGSLTNVRLAIEYFHKYWDEIEKYRGMAGTHRAPYGVAPYYFYFGHRFCAQAIQLLPENERYFERQRLIKKVLRDNIRDKDGLWNDRVWQTCRGFGSSMVLALLLGDQQPLPPRLQAQAKEPEKAP